MDKSKDNVNKLQVYYDGLCKVCSFEIEHYKKQKGAENINFVDITLADFNAEKEGLNPLFVHKYLHAKNEEGQIVSGVETFRLIWQKLPKYNWAFQFSKNKLVSSSLNLGYQFFVQVRPYLPRYKDQCKDSPYCEVKHT
jgi:predicted DCC family thiol-disulfide oxidoreductase YuxK